MLKQILVKPLPMGQFRDHMLSDALVLNRNLFAQINQYVCIINAQQNRTMYTKITTLLFIDIERKL